MIWQIDWTYLTLSMLLMAAALGNVKLALKKVPKDAIKKEQIEIVTNNASNQTIASHVSRITELENGEIYYEKWISALDENGKPALMRIYKGKAE